MRRKYKFLICLTLMVVLGLAVCLSACENIIPGTKPDNNPNDEKVTYTVSYAPGASDATGAIPNVHSYEEGEEVTLLGADTFARSGYTFTTWSYDNATYKAGAKFIMPANDVTFTARWEKNTTPPVTDTSTTVTAKEVKFESGNLVFKGTAGGGVKSLVAYLYDTNEGISSYKATANIGADGAFTVKIALSQLTAEQGNWYYLMTSVNGGDKVKVDYSNYDEGETYEYGSRRYKWEYYQGIAVNYVNLSCSIDMSAVAVRAGQDGHVYLSVSGTYSGYVAQDFDMDMQLQAGKYPIYSSDVTVSFNRDTFTVKMDISNAAATSNGQYYSIHLFVNGASKDVACNYDPWIVETSATDDNKIFKLKSGKSWWDSNTYLMQVSIEQRGSQFTQQDYLKVNGADIRKNYGNGDRVMLRGVNAGGYFVTESWMCAVGEGMDYKTASEILVNRFGEETMQDLWAYYRSYYWTDKDFQNCKDMGITAIRLPFTYMNVDYKQNGEYDFSALDDFVRGAAKYGIYTILDLHGAYGSQNGQDHSGEEMSSSQVDFYRNAEKKAKTVALWKALATHYKDNPAVAAFDLLNEPGIKGGLTSKTQWDFYNEMYKAIREVDGDRILIFESCWAGSDMPRPSQYGWTNCTYSFHHYTEYDTSQSHISSFENRLREVNNCNFGIPLYMGEFTAYGNEEDWVRTLELLNNYGWHWTSWTYKTNYSMGGWGIYYTPARRPDLSSDSINDIKDKWRGTSMAYAQETVLGSSKLKDIFKSALS